MLFERFVNGDWGAEKPTTTEDFNKKIIEFMESGNEYVNSIIDFSNWLYIAALEGKIEIVKYLLSSGVTMDISNSKNNPLFGAIEGCNLEVAKLLIENGIDIRVKYTGQAYSDALDLVYRLNWRDKLRKLENRVESRNEIIGLLQ